MPDHNDPLEQRISAALEHAPIIHIPAGFAARVAAQAPARPTSRFVRAPRIGRTTAFAATVLLAALMLLLLPATLAGARTPQLLEYAFTLEFLTLVLYTTLRPGASLL